LLHAQKNAGIITSDEHNTKMNQLGAKHGIAAWQVSDAGSELVTKDSSYSAHVKANMPPSPTKTFKGKEYETPQSIVTANAWGDKHFANWRKTLTSGEVEAFKGYSKHGDGPINSFLRFGKLGDENDPFSPQKPSTVHKRIKHLDDAIAKTTVPTNVVAVRGFSHQGLVDMMKKGQNLEGAVFHDNAFVSTSINNKGGFSGSIKMKIHVPAGSKGAYMDGNMKLTHFPGEAELLLGRDSNFRIVGYKPGKSSWDPWDLEVEYLGTGPLPAGAYKSFKADN